MDRITRLHLLPFFQNFGQWVSKYRSRGPAAAHSAQTVAFKPATEQSPRTALIRSGCFLLASFALATWIHPRIQHEAAQAQLRTLWPSRLIWEGTLTQAGYRRLTPSENGLQERMLSKLKLESLDSGGVWISTDQCWIALAYTPLAPEQIELWTCGGEVTAGSKNQRRPPAPKLWDYGGSGLQALLHLPLKNAPPSAKMPKRSILVDPLEIRY